MVDDHAIVREGLSAFLNTQPDIEVVAAAGNLAEAGKILAENSVELIILDLSLGHESGFSLLAEVASRKLQIRLLVFSMHSAPKAVQKAIAMGARGFIMKSEPSDYIPTAIRRIMKGEVFISEKVALIAFAELDKDEISPDTSPMVLELLTARELEIFKLLSTGLKPSEMAKSLKISVKTANAHRENIKQKLCCKNSSQLMAFAIRYFQQE